MISRLGPTRWKALHRLAYLVAIGAVIHYYMLVKSDVRQPACIWPASFGLLLAYRAIHHYVSLRAGRPGWTRQKRLSFAAERAEEKNSGPANC